MDVLTADALTLSDNEELDCLVQLVEYLGAKRSKYAKKLHRAIQRPGSQFLHDLKRKLKQLQKVLKHAENNDSTRSDAVLLAIAKAIELSSGLRFPTKLNRSNLHPYRLRVKELRNVLQLSDQADDQEFVEKLGEVKDAIGGWHDWEELTAIAVPLLDHRESCKLIKRLHLNCTSALERALIITSRFQDKYLKSTRPGHRPRNSKFATLSGPVLRATSAIA
jgi:CHAD domain-containing protein